MKKIVHKILAVFMVTILMVSTTSFSIYKHFCGDNLVEVSRYTVTESCCSSEKENHSKNISTELNFSEKECCKSETEITPQITFENTKPLKLVKNQFFFIASYYYSFMKPIEENGSKTDHYNNFSPPKIVFNKQIQFQTFLI